MVALPKPLKVWFQLGVAGSIAMFSWERPSTGEEHTIKTNPPYKEQRPLIYMHAGMDSTLDWATRPQPGSAKLVHAGTKPDSLDTLLKIPDQRHVRV